MPFSIKEVRHSLFRIHWNFENRDHQEGVCKEVIKMYKTGRGRGLIFTYHLEIVLDKLRDTPYLITITVEVSSSSKEFSDCETTVTNSTTRPQQNQQPLTETTVCPGGRGGWICRKLPKSGLPVAVWIHIEENYKDETHLGKTEETDKWIKKLRFSRSPEDITLWVDFGAASENKMISTMGKLADMFRNQTLCDVQFNFIGGQSVGAHVAILSAGSPVFAAMFQSTFMESLTRQVMITDIEVDVFKQLLVYMYTGSKPKLEEENVTLLFVAADKYGIETLKEVCADDLLEQLETENVINMLVWSHFHSIAKVFEGAMKILVDNCCELCFQSEWLDFTKNYPDLSVMATQRIALATQHPNNPWHGCIESSGNLRSSYGSSWSP
jgi:speckle-type POZ protein